MVDEIISDESLVEGLRLGSKESHAQLWQKYGDDLIRFLQPLGADSQEAADVATDAVARAVDKINQFDFANGKGKAPFRNWLFTIARNLLRDLQRKRQKLTHFNDEMSSSGIAGISDGPPEEIVQALNKALSELPNNYREVITLHFYDGLSLTEIAALMGVPDGTVRQWKKRAIELLEAALKDLPIFASFLNRE